MSGPGSVSDNDAALILPSLSSSSSPTTDKKPLKSRHTLIAEALTAQFESLRSVFGQQGALQILKDEYASYNDIVSGIQGFQLLLSKNLDREQMLKVVDAIADNDSKSQREKHENKTNLAATTLTMKRKKQKGDLQESIKRYRCKECKQVFASFQALGGHTASHNREKKTENEVGCREEDEAEKKNSTYKCEVCCKSFSTGQALGGHKTGHMTGNNKIKSPFNIDLNQ